MSTTSAAGRSRSRGRGVVLGVVVGKGWLVVGVGVVVGDRRVGVVGSNVTRLDLPTHPANLKF